MTERRALKVRKVGLRRRGFAQVPIFHVGDYSNHLNVRWVSGILITNQSEVPSDGIAGGEIAFGKALIDHPVFLRTSVLVCKFAAFEDGNAEGGEIIRASFIEDGLLLLQFSGRLV